MLIKFDISLSAVRILKQSFNRFFFKILFFNILITRMQGGANDRPAEAPLVSGPKQFNLPEPMLKRKK